MTLGFAIHNIFKFLINQGRYKTYTVTMFYVFSVAVCILRITEYLVAMVFIGEQVGAHPRMPDVSQIYMRAENVHFLSMASFQIAADTFKTSLGFFPVASMFELALRLGKDRNDLLV